ncbi:hypothetical protein JG688_00015809 [Phytophthora aleatoria]|uniref:SET domain-containing protein n=1 Tax=Phytophthora aleatoria TaxID=2496075 RepID=A0A8J5IF46_9STRA|nr:hypothetical protein JG688_00015809 [Phytophthora aleatoria]
MSGALALGLSLEKGIVLLANKEIHPGDFIIQYTGEVITHGRITARVMCKWDVNGDSCCGLIGKVPIPRGEEVTFASTPPKSKVTLYWHYGGWHVTSNCSYNRSLYWLVQLKIAASDKQARLIRVS